MAQNSFTNTNHITSSFTAALLTASAAEDAWTEVFLGTAHVSSLVNMTSELRIDNDVTRFTECPSHISTCQAQKYLFLVMAPILILFTSVGNGLSLAVMTRNSLRNTATAVFISCLAVSDTIAVWTGLTRHFIFKLTQVK